MRLLVERPWYAEANSQRLVSFCFFLIAVIAAAEAVLIPDLGWGYLYLFPLVIAAAFLSRWQALGISAICAIFSEGLSHSLEGPERIFRSAFMFTAYVFLSLAISKFATYRRSASRRFEELESDLRNVHAAKEALESLVNTSAVGMITISSAGTIVACNRAAHDILAVGPGGLVGERIDKFLPASGRSAAPGSPVEQVAIKATGQNFRVRIWTAEISRDSSETAIVLEPLNQVSEQFAGR